MTTTGEEFIRRVCEPAWRRHRLLPAHRTLLAFDCDPYDLSRSLAARFRLVLDLESTNASAVAARHRHADVPNLRFAEGREEALSKVPEDGVDVCFSCAPIDCDGRGRRGNRGLIAQFARVLKPGGLAHFRIAPPGAEGFGAVLRRWIAGRNGFGGRIERALTRAGLVPVERTRTSDGETWIVARKPWK